MLCNFWRIPGQALFSLPGGGLLKLVEILVRFLIVAYQYTEFIVFLGNGNGIGSSALEIIF